LLTGHGKYGSLIQIDMDPDIGIFKLEPSGILKGANPLTIAAAQAPLRFNEYDFHAILYLRPFIAWNNSLYIKTMN